MMGPTAESHAPCLYLGPTLGAYGFSGGHPFGPDRMEAFQKRLNEKGLDARVRICTPVRGDQTLIERFHTAEYVDQVRALSERGRGTLDFGDTPAEPGIFEAASVVVGTAVDAAERLLAGDCPSALVPIGGLHHARRHRASGFCVLNDCGVVIETLKTVHGCTRIAYVDIDAHHGDGVYYAFEADPAVWIADIHQDGRSLFPGTGDASEEGQGEAVGTKLNLPQPPGADTTAFYSAWERVEAHLDRARPEFIILQCGADSMAGDPLAGLAFTPETHRWAASRLLERSKDCRGGLLALGGGGYDRKNLGEAWSEVVAALIEEP
ncbi:acetoin utilization protein AcuC [Thiohalorhabdus methylotrophus]|uniref:Acetoin utilization protein AcuC n=1 Tax=Thiohalorhabdus methylotrophus TaxID=3242694 RepID=A0ABV4TYL6_9GAMM